MTERLASLGTMGALLSAPLKPIGHVLENDTHADPRPSTSNRADFFVQKLVQSSEKNEKSIFRFFSFLVFEI